DGRRRWRIFTINGCLYSCWCYIFNDSCWIDDDFNGGRKRKENITWFDYVTGILLRYCRRKNARYYIHDHYYISYFDCVDGEYGNFRIPTNYWNDYLVFLFLIFRNRYWIIRKNGRDDNCLFDANYVYFRVYPNV